jgi:hypothetical protein
MTYVQLTAHIPEIKLGRYRPPRLLRILQLLGGVTLHREHVHSTRLLEPPQERGVDAHVSHELVQVELEEFIGVIGVSLHLLLGVLLESS